MDVEEARRTLASVQLARDHATGGRHGAATALLMQALQSVPQLADELEGDLTFSLKAYGEHLAAIGQPNKALWLYSQAIPLLPRPRGMHTNLGALQYSIGKAGASIESFQRALALDPGYWPALESLENVKSLAVDRWHFRMLNDSARNEAYSRAIRRAVAAAAADRHGSEVGVTVLDIGTGTGILAVMAARAGAAHVYACEVNGVLCDIAKEVLERNGVADRVTVIHKSSGALQPGVDIPERGVDVVVTELVDSGLLGERIIPVLTDARARGLLAEGGRVIPEGACVYAAVLESEAVQSRSRLLPGSPAGLATGTVRPTNEEPYTCEDLRRLEHELLTSPTAVLEVDFLEVGAALVGASARPSSASTAPSPPVSAAHLPVQRSGRADAAAVWFDLWLDGERGDRDVVSTRPERRSRGDASGWDAGIYFASGNNLREGGQVRFEASAGLDRLRFAINGQEGFLGDSVFTCSRQSERANQDASGPDSRSSTGSDGPVFLGEMDLARLNDGRFHSSHANAVAQALAAQGVELRTPGSASTSDHRPPSPSLHVSPPPPPPPPAFVLDLCGAWGVAGLLVAQLERGAGSGASPPTRVLAVAESEEAAAALNAIARENGLGPDRYVATADKLVDLASRGRIVVEAADSNHQGGNLGDDRNRAGRNWPDRGSGSGWAVVMASSVVEGSGLLKQGALGDLELARQFTSISDDASGVAFVPGRLEVVCQGLQRASLFSENKVHGDCCGVDVGAVNAFSVESFRELDLSAAAPCSSSRGGSSVEAAGTGTGKIDDSNSRGGASYEGKKDGTDTDDVEEEEEEAFLTEPVVCYDLDLASLRAGLDGCFERRVASLRVERAGTLHAVAYWYRQYLGRSLVLDTRPTPGASDDGLERACHFRQAAVLLNQPIAVEAGQRLELRVFCNTSKGFIVQVLGVNEDVRNVGGDDMCT